MKSSANSSVMYRLLACMLTGCIAFPSGLAAATRSHAAASHDNRGAINPAFDPNQRTLCPAQYCRSSHSATASCVLKDNVCVWNNVPLYVSPYDLMGVGH
jgi:hypothetical protein